MSTTRNSIITALALGITAAAGAATVNLHFEEWELGGAFTYNASLLDHELGSAGTVRPGGWNEISVTSGPGTGGWDYQLVVDYTGYCLGCLNPGGSLFVDIDTSEYFEEVTSVHASTGSVSIVGGSLISWSSAPTSIVTLPWNATLIPAPGAFALLGLAGACGMSRRRRS